MAKEPRLKLVPIEVKNLQELQGLLTAKREIYYIKQNLDVYSLCNLHLTEVNAILEKRWLLFERMEEK